LTLTEPVPEEFKFCPTDWPEKYFFWPTRGIFSKVQNKAALAIKVLSLIEG